MARLILASGSPRRADLLRSVGIDFVVAPADIDETPWPGESATTYVERMANEKCIAARQRLAADDSAIVLGADTVVVVDGEILGKPIDDVDASQMLRRLSGRSHDVFTAVCVANAHTTASTCVATSVTFGDLSDADIHWYVSRGESLDKAGGYGMQTAGGVLVERIDGSPTNVIGLPLREVVALLAAKGLILRPTFGA